MKKTFITIGTVPGVGNTTISHNLQEGFFKRNIGNIVVIEGQLDDLKPAKIGKMVPLVDENIYLLINGPEKMKDSLVVDFIKKPKDKRIWSLFNKVPRGQFLSAEVYNSVKDFNLPILNSQINHSELYESCSESGSNIYAAGENIAVAQMNTLIEELLARFWFR